MATGKGHLSAVRAVFAFVASPAQMMECGFLVEELCSPKYKGYELDSGIVGSQNELAEKLHRLQTELAAQRMGSLARVWSQPPMSFAALLGPPRMRDWCLAKLRDLWTAFKEAKKLDTPFWQQLVKRSPFQWEVNKLVMLELERKNWVLDPSLQSALTRIFSDFGSTCPVETSFQKTRRCESERPDKHLTGLQCWMKPVFADVLQKDFSFHSVSMESVPEQPSKTKARIPRAFFKSSAKRQSVPCRSLVGKGRTPHPSFSAGSSRVLAEEMELLHFLHTRGLMARAALSWRSKIMQPGMLVYNRALKKDKVFMSFGAYSCCACLWPAKRVVTEKPNSVATYVLEAIETVDELLWAPVLEFKDWTVLECPPVSPMHFFLKNGRKPITTWPQSFRVQVEDRPQPLLRVAAKRAFWRLPAEFIDRLIADEYALELPPKTTFPRRLLAVIEAVLECTPLEATNILEQRCTAADLVENCAEIMESEEVQNMMNKDDLKDHQKDVENQVKFAEKCAFFAEEIKNRRQELGHEPSRTRKMVRFLGDRSCTEEAANKLCPPGYYIRRIPEDARWRIFSRIGKWTNSHAWGPTNAERTCVAACLREAWKRCESLNGPKCHIENLDEF